MKRFFVVLVLSMAACGGSSGPTCPSTPCTGNSALSYETCEVGTTVTYKLGKMMCSFGSTDQAGATECDNELNTYCAGN